MKLSRRSAWTRRVRRAQALASATLAAAGVVVAGTPALAGTAHTFLLTSNHAAMAALPAAAVGRPYEVHLTDGSPRRSDDFLTIAGDWPRGISMSISGLIAGTPQLPQTAHVLVEAYNVSANKQVRLEWLDLTVGSGLTRLDPMLIPLGTSIAGGVNAFASEFGDLVSTITTIASCVTDPQAPPGCLFAAGL